MRAAGCKIPTPSPTARWEEEWSWLVDAARRQRLLPEEPPWGVICGGIDANRLAPRPDWAPPAQLPAHFVCVYAAGSHEGDAWAVIAVDGQDATQDADAQIAREAGGPVVIDTNAAQYTHATARSSPWQATLCAVTECLRLITEGAFGHAPVLIRVNETWAPAIAGLSAPDDDGAELTRHVLRLLGQCRTTRDVWLTTSRQGQGQWWADRAIALADQCAGARWGQPAMVWQPIPIHPGLRGAGDECPICYDDFTDPLPRPRDPLARAPEAFHACRRHAACIGCDEHNNDHRCCICRAARHPWA